MDKYIARDHTSKDKNYILTYWLKHLHKIPPFAGSRHRLFMPHASRFIEAVLNAPKSKVMILCLNDRQDFIISFTVFWQLEKSTVLWWHHTRDQYRQKGIFKHVAEKMPGKKAFVFDRKLPNDTKLSTKVLDKLGYEYWPALIFEAIEIGEKNAN